MIIALFIETALSIEFVDIFYTDFWQFEMKFPICFLLFLFFFLTRCLVVAFQSCMELMLYYT